MVTNWWDGLKGVALQARDRVVSEHDQKIYLAGFESAVSTFMPLLDDRIEVLDSRLESGTLSQDDQKVLGALRSLRKESDKRLLAHLDADGLEPGVGVGH